MGIIDWWESRGRKVENVNYEKSLSRIPATIIGVYGTAHTSIGDMDSGPPTSVSIDCEITTFVFPLDIADCDYSIETFTVHFGTHWVNVPVFPVMQIRKGDFASVIQPIGMDGLSYGPKPGWAQ